MQTARKPEPDAFFEDPISKTMRRVPAAPAVGSPLVAPSVSEQTVRPRLWIACCSVLFVLSVCSACVLAACGLLIAAFYCVASALLSGFLLALADDLGRSN